MLVRALLVLLLVLNVGVAAWWLVRDPAPPPVPVEPSPGAARLQLVGEAALEAPAAPVAATATAAMSATAAPAAAAATTAPVAMITTAMPAPPDQTPAALLEKAAQGNAAPPTRQCFSFGPFASKPAADTAAAKLRPLAQKVVQRELAKKKPAPQGWRVFLPPHASLEAAQAAVQRIGAAGFTDFIVVRQGPEANAVILGRYSNEEGARRHAQALAAAGFAARVEPVVAADEASPVWLDVAADAAFDPRRTQAAIRAPQHRTLDCARLR